MRQLSWSDRQSPIAALNTTPLIDVLLVLLVMLVITVPPQSHAVKFDLPIPTTKIPPAKPLKNELVINRSGALLWNGVPISDEVLRSELELTQQMSTTPELDLRPDADARYGRVDEVLAIIKSEHVRNVGFVGTEAYLNV